MAIRVALNHRTSYRYASDVWLSPHVVRLHPAPHCRTPVTSYSLKTTPKDPFVNWQQDPYSNRLARLVFPEKTRELSVEVDLVAELTVINPFDFFVESYAELYPFAYDEVLQRELTPYLDAAPAGPSSPPSSSRSGPPGSVPSISSCPSTVASRATSGTSSASSPACRRPRRR